MRQHHGKMIDWRCVPAAALAILLAGVATSCSSQRTAKDGAEKATTTQVASNESDTGTTLVRPDRTATSTSPLRPTSPSVTVGTDANGAIKMQSYFEPTEQSFNDTVEFLGDGPFVMLNLFRLRDEPDFSNHPELRPDTPMSSRDLFYQYIAHMDSYLERVGAKRVLLADGGPLLIGPTGERWDVVQMVEYPNTQSFLELGILVRGDTMGTREVMLLDSRIMPMHQKSLDSVNP